MEWLIILVYFFGSGMAFKDYADCRDKGKTHEACNLGSLKNNEINTDR